MKLTNEQKGELKKIYQLTHVEMARLKRFALPGHPWFDIFLPYNAHFERRFKRLGGMTPTISKFVGWGNGKSYKNNERKNGR